MPFPPEIDLEDEFIYIRLRMLPSFCNTETVNRELKKVGWGEKSSGQVYGTMRQKEKKNLFDLVWQFGTCAPESRCNQISLSTLLSTGLTSQDTGKDSWC